MPRMSRWIVSLRPAEVGRSASIKVNYPAGRTGGKMPHRLSSCELMEMSAAQNPALLPEPKAAQALLEAYLLEKALYEVLYELNHRPAWLRIPLNGILAL